MPKCVCEFVVLIVFVSISVLLNVMRPQLFLTLWLILKKHHSCSPAVLSDSSVLRNCSFI